MSFLSPIWLWVAAAIAVPVVIHLLSRGRGRTVAIGSVRFLPAAQSHRLRKIRPSGLLRLLLRAGLIASLAVALAGPRFWSALPFAPGERWLLVDPALLTERDRLETAASDIYRRLDAAPASERRLLTPGLPRWTGHVVDAPPATDVWSLIAEADRFAPPGAALEAFVLDRAESYAGVRPALGRPVEWHSVTDPDSNRWIQRAVRTADDIEVTIGASDAGGTRFSQVTVSSATTDGDGLAVDAGGNADTVRLTAGGSRRADDLATVPHARPPFTIAVDAAENRATDAAAVLGAASAVAAHLGRPLARVAATGEPVDLAVGLGTGVDGVPATTRLLDGEEGVPCRQSVFVPALTDPWLRVTRCGETGDGPARWRGAWGQPLLTVDRGDTESTWRWHGRFDPTWSDLTQSGLPHLLLGVVAPDDERANGAVDAESDRRASVAGHDRPAHTERPAPTAPNRLPERLAWALVVVLFAVDRLLVRRVT